VEGVQGLRPGGTVKAAPRDAQPKTKAAS
jgi:hypothetical protein